MIRTLLFFTFILAIVTGALGWISGPLTHTVEDGYHITIVCFIMIAWVIAVIATSVMTYCCYEDYVKYGAGRAER